MWKLWVHLDYDHFYIPLISKHKAAVVGVKTSEKSFNISGLKSPYHRLANKKKLILPLRKYSKTLKDMSIGTVGTYVFESFTIFQNG